MRPCDTAVAAAQTIATTASATVPTSSSHCLTDFAGNVGCLPPRTIRIDNNAPAHPRSLAVAGGEGWRRINDFDLAWEQPRPGGREPDLGRLLADRRRRRLRHRGPVRPRPRRRRGSRSLAAGAGQYSLLPLAPRRSGQRPGRRRGRSAAALRRRAARRRLRGGHAGAASPSSVCADLFDEHSGPAGGEIRYRRLGVDPGPSCRPASFAARTPAEAQLVARLPESLPAGTYLFRAEAADGAGNSAITTRRADGTEMTLRKPPPPPAERPGREAREEPAAAARGEDAALRPSALARAARDLGDRALRRARRPHRPPPRRRRRRALRPAHPGRGAALAGGAGADPRRGGARPGSTAASASNCPPGPSRRMTVAFRGEQSLDRARRRRSRCG